MEGFSDMTFHKIQYTPQLHLTIKFYVTTHSIIYKKIQKNTAAGIQTIHLLVLSWTEDTMAVACRHHQSVNQLPESAAPES